MPKIAPEVSKSREAFVRRYRDVRTATECICAPLAIEDCVVQSMLEVSPTRWHLAHTTWFFETLVLARETNDYRPHDPAYSALFNSYYNSIGEPFSRARRGLLTRPSVEQVYGYRREIDRRVQRLLRECDDESWRRIAPLIELGLHHEQQHGELILTDIKHVLSCNPLYPAYGDSTHRRTGSRGETASRGETPVRPVEWIDGSDGVCWVGHNGEGFAYDNESPRHRQFVHPHQLAIHPTTNAEYLEFIEDGGYRRHEIWLSQGWDIAVNEGWQAPLYWVQRSDGWQEFTLAGLRPLEPDEPVCHVSYFEAAAFARWADARLPTEAEWEVAATQLPCPGDSTTDNFVEGGRLHPALSRQEACGSLPLQMYGDVWEWTSSSYGPYPGYRPAAGAVGEYNGKFMCNQYVLRGGSCVSSASHIRPTYRNFFPPEARWQFSGIRLAR